MRKLVTCTACKKPFWTKEKPKNKFKAEVCLTCRGYINRFKQYHRIGIVKEKNIKGY